MTGALIGTDDGAFVVDLDAGGDPGAAGLAGHAVRSLQASGRWLWAIVDGRAVTRGVAGGRWSDLAPIEPWAGNCLAVSGEGVWVGTSEAHLLRGSGEGPADGGAGGLTLVEGFEAVDGRDGWYTPWGGPPDTRSISIAASGAIHANVHVGGIVRSDDGGETWRPTIDVDADVHQVLAHPDHDDLVLAATAYGMAVGRDGGARWDFHTEGLHGNYQRSVAVAGEWIVVSASEGHIGRRSAIYRAPFADTLAFERCGNGLPEWFGSNVDTGALDASGSDVLFGTADGDVFASRDAGASWDQVASELPAVRSVALA